MTEKQLKDSQMQVIKEMARSWTAAVQEMLERWYQMARGGLVRLSDAVGEMRAILGEWPERVYATVAGLIDRMFSDSYRDGASAAEVEAWGMGPSEGQALAWMKNSPNGLVPALRDLTRGVQRRIERGLSRMGSVIPVSSALRLAMDVASRVVSRPELIVRTESAKARALGRIYAWGHDRYRDRYHYWWIAMDDDRTKDVSLLFERAGPYAWQQIRHLWEFEHDQPQLVRNRHTRGMEMQVSAWNCRCTVARTPRGAVAV
jgi:hypothetical protein